MKHKIYITEKMIKDILLILLSIVIITGSFFGCEEKQDPSKIPYGTYTCTNKSGDISTLILTKDTICVHNGEYTTSKELYAVRFTMSAIAEANAEGITLTKEEKEKIYLEAENSIDFTLYDGVELGYFLEYEEVSQFINIHPTDEDGNEILGLLGTYEIKDKELIFADGYYKLQD